MSKPGKIVLGILSLIPLLCFIAYILVFFGIFTSVFQESIQQPGRPPEAMMSQMGQLLAIVPLFIVSWLGLLIYYIIHIVNNPRLEGIERLVWIIITIFTGVIGYLIYWYMQIWKGPGSSPATQS